MPLASMVSSRRAFGAGSFSGRAKPKLAILWEYLLTKFIAQLMCVVYVGWSFDEFRRCTGTICRIRKASLESGNTKLIKIESDKLRSLKETIVRNQRLLIQCRLAIHSNFQDLKSDYLASQQD